jgi:uncharacterized protein (TIGR00255 family)
VNPACFGNDPQHDRLRGTCRGAAGVALAVELRSVNHRFLDLQVRLPDELRALEAALRERILAAVKRGKVECRISLTRAAADASGLAVDLARVRRTCQGGGPGDQGRARRRPMSVGEILRWPGVLAEPTVAPAELAAHAHRLLGQAIAELSASREREGAKLATMLLERCDGIEREVARVAPRIPALQAAFAEKLGARLREAGLDPKGAAEAGTGAVRDQGRCGGRVVAAGAHLSEFRRVLARAAAPASVSTS